MIKFQPICLLWSKVNACRFPKVACIICIMNTSHVCTVEKNFQYIGLHYEQSVCISNARQCKDVGLVGLSPSQAQLSGTLPVHLCDLSLSSDSFKPALKTYLFAEYQWYWHIRGSA